MPLYREFETAYRPRLLDEQHLHHLAHELTATIARLDNPETYTPVP